MKSLHSIKTRMQLVCCECMYVKSGPIILIECKNPQVAAVWCLRNYRHTHTHTYVVFFPSYLHAIVTFLCYASSCFLNQRLTTLSQFIGT